MKGGGGGGGGAVVVRRWRKVMGMMILLVIVSILLPSLFLLLSLGGGGGYKPDEPTTTSTTSTTSTSTNSAAAAASSSSSSSSSHYSVPTHSQQRQRQQQQQQQQQLYNNRPIDLTLHAHQRPQPTHDLRLPPPPPPPLNYNEFCELSYGTYCHWRQFSRQPLKDDVLKKIKDLLFVSRAYFPSIAKIPEKSSLSQELKHNIQELEHILGETTADPDLPPQIDKKLKKVEASLAKAKACKVVCENVDKKLRQILDSTEDETKFHMEQSAFLYQLVVQTKPKNLHCLSMKLTVECFKTSVHDMDLQLSEKFSDPVLHHYVIFSNNVLACSIVINSTVVHARESQNLVFHVVTDKQNLFAMKLWFFNNTFAEATIQVLNIEDLELSGYDNADLLSDYLPVEFRISLIGSTKSTSSFSTTEYVSLFSPMHYLLPYIFPNLNKVVVLDDDVVVLRDLNFLWNLNMNGKVNGASRLCSVHLNQLTSYLGGKNFEIDSCAWMSGLNIIDLVRWKQLDLTATYQKLGEEAKNGAVPVEAVALRANLLTFQDQIYPLDDNLVLSGLGRDYGLEDQAIQDAVVLHYNGLMKPWLDLGIPRYKQYWRRFLTRENEFLSECKINA